MGNSLLRYNQHLSVINRIFVGHWSFKKIIYWCKTSIYQTSSNENVFLKYCWHDYRILDVSIFHYSLIVRIFRRPFCSETFQGRTFLSSDLNFETVALFLGEANSVSISYRKRLPSEMESFHLTLFRLPKVINNFVCRGLSEVMLNVKSWYFPHRIIKSIILNPESLTL